VTVETDIPPNDQAGDGQPRVREGLAASAAAVILLWLNVYICREMFYAPTTQMNSMQGTWIGLAKNAAASWFHATWWPFWDLGGPFEYTYAPLVPALTAAWSAVARLSHNVAFHNVMGLFFCLAPLTLFLMAWRLTRAVWYSFIAALVYSLVAITQMIVPDTEFGLTKVWDARRLFLVSAWDETPHMAAVALLPLTILFLARAIQTRRPVYFAAAALSIGAQALTSAFGPVMIVMAAFCLLLAIRREHLASNAVLVMLLGLWGWAIAGPFLSPSLVQAIRKASANASEAERWTVQSYTALAVLILGWTIVWGLLRRWKAEPELSFFVQFGYLTTMMPMMETVLHRHLLPQPGRYWMEMEMAMSVALVFGLRRWAGRAPRRVRWAMLLLLCALTAEQVVHHRKDAKRFLATRDLTQTAEYKTAVWCDRNVPGLRVFLPGSVAQWANSFAAVPQFAGGSFTMSINPVQRMGKESIYWNDNPQVQLMWLKAYGTAAIALSEKTSKEYWHPYNTPEKMKAILPALWSEDGMVMCRVPLRETGLAHVVPAGAVVTAEPKFEEDQAEVKRYVAALDDQSLPLTRFAWEGRNRIRIHADLSSGQAVSVQVSYHPGWHASAGGRKLELRKDGLGMMWLRPGPAGSYDVQMDYDGGWELRLTRWASWLAAGGALGVLLLTLKRGLLRSR
jgi:hypothetical protein